MSLKIPELVSTLSSTDIKLVGITCEAIHKSVLAEGFNRFQPVNGVRIHRDKSFPACFLPLIQCFIKLLSTNEGSGGDPLLVKNVTHIISLMCRSSKSFAKWIYTVPKFIACYLKLIRSAISNDQELAMRLLKTLQLIVLLEKKACLILRLEGGIKTLMACIGNGGGAGTATMRSTPTSSIATSTTPPSGETNSLTLYMATAAAASSSISSSSSSTHSTAHQKLLRILVELLLVIIKANEHNSTALVTQSLPHLSNLLHLLRNQQSHTRIFQTTLQIMEKLCKEKKILTALLGAPAPLPSTANDDGVATTSTAMTNATPPSSIIPTNSVAVQSLLSALGPGVTSFMTWCMYTLLNSKIEVLNVLLRLIFLLAGSKVGFAILIANGGVEVLLPAIQTQLHKSTTVRAVTALIWQQQKQSYGHLIPKVDPLYKFHEAGLKVYFTKDGRVLKEADWEAEREAMRIAKLNGITTINTTEVIQDEIDPIDEPPPAEVEEEVADDSIKPDPMETVTSETELLALEPPAVINDSSSIATVPAATDLPSSMTEPVPAIVLADATTAAEPAPSPTPIDDDDSGLPVKDSSEDENEEDEGAGKKPVDTSAPGSDEDEDENDKSGGSGSSGSDEDADSGDETAFKKKPKPGASTMAIKKSPETLAAAIPSALPTLPLTPMEIEKVKTLLAQAMAASIPPTDSPATATAAIAASISSPTAATPPIPPAPKLGLGPGDAEFAWAHSPELWDPEDPATSTRMQQDLAEVKQACYNVPKSVSTFIQSTPVPFHEDERGRRIPGIALSGRSEPLADTNPLVLIEKMMDATQRFVNPASFMGRVVYDKDAGGSLVHLLPPITPPISSPSSGSSSPNISTSPTPPSTDAINLIPALPTSIAALSIGSPTSGSTQTTQPNYPRSSPTTVRSPSPPTNPARRLVSPGSSTVAPKSSTTVTTKVAFGGSIKTSQPTPKLSLDGSKKLLTATRVGLKSAPPKPTAPKPTTPTAPSSSTSPAVSKPPSPSPTSSLKRRGTAPAGRQIKSPITTVPSTTSSTVPTPAPLKLPSVPKQSKPTQPTPPLIFESRFESGNLHRVVQVSDSVYDLVLSTDVNSRGYTQWFFFQIKSAVPNVKYQFNMLNLEKNHSTFNTGMKPVMYSQKMFDKDGIGWHRACSIDEVAYYHNYHARPYDDAASRLKVGTSQQEDEMQAAEEDEINEEGNGMGEEAKETTPGDEPVAKKKKKIVTKSTGKRIVKKKSFKSSPEASPESSAPVSRSMSPSPDQMPKVANSPIPSRGTTDSNEETTTETSPTNISPNSASPALRPATVAPDATADVPPVSARTVADAQRPSSQPLLPTKHSSAAAGGDPTSSSTHSGLIEFDMTPAPKKKLLKKKGKSKGAKSTNKDGAGVPKKRKVLKKSGKKSETFYTLSFSVKFPYADDTILLAYHYPFTYSFQRECLDSLVTSSQLTNNCLRRQKLCLSRGGNLCELLTITEFPRNQHEVELVKKRKLVVLSARIHPGESNASWIMKGLLEYLVGPSESAAWLRQNIVFKIVPMLNLDGVIEGNYRTSLSGVDLNRHWDSPSPIVHPTIFHTRKLLLSLSVNRSLLLFCDFHGHSAMKNMCLYGCDLSKGESSIAPPPLNEHLHFAHIREALQIGPSPSTPLSASSTMGGSAATAAALLRTRPNEPIEVASSVNPLLALPPSLNPSGRAVLAAPLLLELRAAHVFPELLARRPEVGSKYFNHSACAFHVRKDKAGTARVVFWRALRSWDVFTFEASFAGGTLGEMKGQHFQPCHYEEMGFRFVETLRELIRVRREKFIQTQQLAWIENAKPITTINTTTTMPIVNVVSGAPTRIPATVEPPAARLVGIELNPGPFGQGSTNELTKQTTNDKSQPVGRVINAQMLFKDAIHLIYAFLTTHEWIAASGTCHAWSTASESEPSRHLSYPIDENGGLQFALANRHRYHFSRVHPHPPNRYLSPFTCEQVCHFLKELPGLTEFQCSLKPCFDVASSSQVVWPKNLLNLTLYFGTDDLPTHFIQSLGNIRSLTKFQISGNYNLKSTNWRAFQFLGDAHTFPDLRELDVQFSNIDFIGAVDLVRLPSSLKRLNFTRSRDMAFDGLHRLAPLPNLAYINLEQRDFRMDDLKMLNHLAPQLTELAPRTFLVEDFQHIRLFRHLQSITFDAKPIHFDRSEVTDSQLLSTLCASTSLTHILFRGWCFSEPDSWSELALKLPTLTSLGFSPLCLPDWMFSPLLPFAHQLRKLYLENYNSVPSDLSRFVELEEFTFISSRFTVQHIKSELASPDLCPKLKRIFIQDTETYGNIFEYNREKGLNCDHYRVPIVVELPAADTVAPPAVGIEPPI